METFLLTVQHVCNPLHVYCRLVDRGINRHVSLQVSGYYEFLVFKFLNLLTLSALGLLRSGKRRLGL